MELKAGNYDTPNRPSYVGGFTAIRAIIHDPSMFRAADIKSVASLPHQELVLQKPSGPPTSKGGYRR
jgi:hypothetical protein